MSTVGEEIRVLHVDDDPEFAEMTATVLEADNDRFTVETATSADVGLSRLAEESVDCVVSDYEMPGQNGIEFLQNVRDRDSELPFILYTGKGSEEVASDAISAGVTDYLQKTTGQQQYELLANRIENAVEQHRARERATRQERILRILRRANQALVTSSTSDEIAIEISTILADASPYTAVWFGEYDTDPERIIPTAVAGIEMGVGNPISLADQQNEPIRTAIRTNEVTITDVPASSLVPWDGDEAPTYAEAIVVPLVYQGEPFGIVTLFSAETDTVDAPEREMLTELGGDVAQALHTAETHRNLRRHRTAVEAVPVGVFILNEDAIIELSNERAARILGREIDTVEGQPFPTLVEAGIFEDAIIEWYVDSVRDMLSSETAMDEAWYETEIDPVDADPREVEVHLTLRPYDEEYRGTVGIIRDVTESRETDEERDLRYEAIFNQTFQFTGLLDPDGTLLEANETALEFGGIEREEVIGKPFWETYWWQVDEATKREVREAVERASDGEFVRYEVEVQGADETIIIDFSLRPVKNDAGEVTYLIPEGRNITELKTVQERERELERQNERLDRFVNVISHDLRNPLNVAQGRLELLSEEYENEHLADAQEAVQRSLTLVDELLELAREGRQARDVEPVDLEASVRGCWRNVDTAEATLNIDVTGRARADASQLKQLFENLIRNSIEHGGPDVTVTVGRLDEGFYLEDDGPGIPAEERESVFDAGYSTTETGTGFGLSIVRQVVESHGWDIQVTESPAGGARFEITDVEFVPD